MVIKIKACQSKNTLMKLNHTWKTNTQKIYMINSVSTSNHMFGGQFEIKSQVHFFEYSEIGWVQQVWFISKTVWTKHITSGKNE